MTKKKIDREKPFTSELMVTYITEPGWPDVERWRPASDLAGPFEPWNEVPQFLPGTKWREYE